MKCFECDSKCLTVYYCGGFHWTPGDKITHVGKACPNCGWESFRTKVPEPLS